MLVKILHASVAINPNSQLFLNRAPALIYFSGAQQDHKLNETGITSKVIRLVKVRSIEEVYFVGRELLREK